MKKTLPAIIALAGVAAIAAPRAIELHEGANGLPRPARPIALQCASADSIDVGVDLVDVFATYEERAVIAVSTNWVDTFGLVATTNVIAGVTNIVERLVKTGTNAVEVVSTNWSTVVAQAWTNTTPVASLSGSAGFASTNWPFDTPWLVGGDIVVDGAPTNGWLRLLVEEE